MALMLQGNGGSLKITEKTEAARREFFKKVETITKTHGSSREKLQDIADQAGEEYKKLFGRVGTHPLSHLKGGKQRIRYIVDREEVWVLYKPPLWQMGGSEWGWSQNVEKQASKVDSMQAGQLAMVKEEAMGVVQEWHGLTQGLHWSKDTGVGGWGFIQRLDVETDGPVVCCKTWRAQKALQVQMAEHIFNKAYMCLVHGRVENKVHYLKCRFSELGASANSAVMLKNDAENDPFFHWGDQDIRIKRKNRQAETFWKPLAYYHRKQDNSDYSLVYVNILSGITHQVRISLQSSGHPLVSDDRYLPKDQALADLQWCPRNFLTEVRADWFDMFGPYEDETRRRYTRMSIENPLPKLFQQVLENRLTLVEKLDPTADLYVGTEYWALGDEQLMNAYPKDEEYRRKVLRWGQRRGIHLETLDRLLLLSKDDIDYILSTYKPPLDRENECWLCPVCGAYNQNFRYGDENVTCGGLAGTKCPTGKRLWDTANPSEVHDGWRWWSGDPTMHLMMVVNHRWLDARRQVLRFSRPSWEKPPVEVDATPMTDEIVKTLEAALTLNLRGGGHGIGENELLQVPGLGDIRLPLGPPPEGCNVNRCRLPGSGYGSRWMFTLKGKARIAHTAKYSCKTTHYAAPIKVQTDMLPSCMLRTEAEKERNLKAIEDKRAKEQLFIENKEREEADKKRKAEQEALDGERGSKRWKKLESESKPGSFYYWNAENGQMVTEQPAEFKESKPVWERIASKTAHGEFYFFNSETGESRQEQPRGAQIKNDKDEMIAWQRRESTSKPGSFYYFNPLTNSNEVYPPTVQPPWSLCESNSKMGQFYYFCEETKESVVDPPPLAKPARAFPPGSSSALAEKAKEAAKQAEERKKKEEEERRKRAEASQPLPPGWKRQTSSKYPGKFYYVDASGNTSWERPKSTWERRSSKSNPGKFYWENTATGETKWT